MQAYVHFKPRRLVYSRSKFLSGCIVLYHVVRLTVTHVFVWRGYTACDMVRCTTCRRWSAPQQHVNNKARVCTTIISEPVLCHDIVQQLHHSSSRIVSHNSTNLCQGTSSKREWTFEIGQMLHLRTATKQSTNCRSHHQHLAFRCSRGDCQTMKVQPHCTMTTRY